MKARRALALSFILVAVAAVATLIFAAMSAAPVLGAQAPSEPSLPGGSTIQGVLVVDDTWGPGLITVTGDILINPGVIITIASGTTVQMTTVDGGNLGADPARVEYLVGGTLRSSGPVTFTSKSGTPACADWVSIYFQPGSNGYLHHTLVEYGVHAVEIVTLNSISIADSTLRFNCHMPPVGNAWGAGMAIYAGTHQVLRTDIYGNQVQAGAGGTWAEGGGVQMVPGAGPTLFQDCKLYDNMVQNGTQDAAGGGMNVLAADPILRHCEIYGNQAFAAQRVFGGGVNLDNSNGVIEANSRIYYNMAMAQSANGYGGGISIGQAMTPVPVVPVIRDSQVTTNTLNVQEAWGYGGGVGFYDLSWTRTLISDTLIADNVNMTGPGGACGGGVGMADGATANLFEDNLYLNNLALSNGNGAGGGGICLFEGNVVTVTNGLLFENHADDPMAQAAGGGGIFSASPVALLINNTLVRNGTTWDGGGVLLLGGTLLNTIVVSNTAGNDGGGVAWRGGAAGFNDVWNNTCLGVGCGPDYANGGIPRPATDIVAPPNFVRVGNLATFYHLRATSLCIDAGTGPGPGIPNDDYDDEARPLGPAWDIGFDEVYPPVFSISKQESGSLVVGAPLTYTLTVLNIGPGPGNGVLITDAVPAGATYLWGGSYASGKVSWMVPNVPSGGSAQVTFAVSTCQTMLTNQSYRVVTSTLGVASPWGTPLVTNLSPPTIQADFGYGPAVIPLGGTVNFHDTTTTNGSPIVAWGWDFGDGSIGSGSSISHTYLTTGTFTVTLTVTDVCGYSDSDSVVNAVRVLGPGERVFYYVPLVSKNH